MVAKDYKVAELIYATLGFRKLLYKGTLEKKKCLKNTNQYAGGMNYLHFVLSSVF